MSKISYSNPFTKEQYDHLVDIIVDAFIDMERRNIPKSEHSRIFHNMEKKYDNKFDEFVQSNYKDKEYDLPNGYPKLLGSAEYKKIRFEMMKKAEEKLKEWITKNNRSKRKNTLSDIREASEELSDIPSEVSDYVEETVEKVMPKSENPTRWFDRLFFTGAKKKSKRKKSKKMNKPKKDKSKKDKKHYKRKGKPSRKKTIKRR
jgi:hypothetical protein